AASGPAGRPSAYPISSRTRACCAPLAARAGLHAACGFPIVLGGDVLGVIEVCSQAVGHPAPDPGTLMATLGSQIGPCIGRQRAEEALRQAQAELAQATRIWCTIQRAKE